MPAFVSALKRVDLPTLGRPTMPHWRLIRGLSVFATKGREGRSDANFRRHAYTGPMPAGDPMSQTDTLLPNEKDLGGGFKVRRLLPSARRAAVGPFVFFDHFGPITAQPGDNHDVRPHPHIGLA